MKKYDILVIGGGGGLKIASPAAAMGYRVAVVEKEAMGGTCLNRGCIPSKMLIHPADIRRTLQDIEKLHLGLEGEVTSDFSTLIQRINKIVGADAEDVAVKYRNHASIDFYESEARFVSDKVITVNGMEITAARIFIATGSRPAIPPIPGLEGTPYMTSREALQNETLPRTMAVVGGGYIGVELGHAYGALGAEVHFVVRSHFLRNEDDAVIEEFTRVFSCDHTIHMGKSPVSVSYDGRTFSIVLRDSQGTEDTLCVEALLVATGVVPNTNDIGLEMTGIDTTDNGYITDDDYLETTVKGVYALGDVIGRHLFRHAVNFEGEYLVRTLLKEGKSQPIFYPVMPHAVFSHPQIASVGRTERQLKAQGIPYVVGLNRYRDSAMGMARLFDHGFVKLLVGKEDRKLLGAHIIGEEASNLIHMYIAFMKYGATVDDLLDIIYIHPALPEIARNAARKARSALK